MIQNEIDWSKIATVEDVLKLDKNLLYDTAPPKDGKITIRRNLTEIEKEDAEYWKKYCAGVMLVTGEAGGGKGVYIHMVAKKLSYYFGKLVVTDTHPRELFGACIPFSFPMLVEQLDRLQEIESGTPRPYIVQGLMPCDFVERDDWKTYRDDSVEGKVAEIKSRGLVPSNCVFKEYDYNRKQFVFIPQFKPYIDSVTSKWLSSRGEVFLRNSVILLDEAGAKYIPKTKPNLSEAQIILNLCNFYRHLQCLIIAVSISVEDLNPKLLDKSLWEAKCVQMDNHAYRYSDNQNDLIFKIYIDQIKYNPLTGTIQKALGKTEILTINASEPREILGGLGWQDIFNTENAQGMYIPSKLRKQ